MMIRTLILLGSVMVSAPLWLPVHIALRLAGKKGFIVVEHGPNYKAVDLVLPPECWNDV